MLPTQRGSFQGYRPGKHIRCCGIFGSDLFYNIYTTISTNYNILYGSFSNIVVLLFWFWFLAWVMCLGISFNRVWWATRRKEQEPIPEEVKGQKKASQYILIQAGADTERENVEMGLKDKKLFLFRYGRNSLYRRRTAFGNR